MRIISFAQQSYSAKRGEEIAWDMSPKKPRLRVSSRLIQEGTLAAVFGFMRSRGASAKAKVAAVTMRVFAAERERVGVREPFDPFGTFDRARFDWLTAGRAGAFGKLRAGEKD